MTTSKETYNHIIKRLNSIGDFTSRPMMGEYLIYFQGTLIGGIYDEKLLLKETPNNEKYNLPKVIPYASAKRTMYYVEELENEVKLQQTIIDTYEDLVKKSAK